MGHRSCKSHLCATPARLSAYLWFSPPPPLSSSFWPLSKVNPLFPHYVLQCVHSSHGLNEQAGVVSYERSPIFLILPHFLKHWLYCLLNISTHQSGTYSPKKKIISVTVFGTCQHIFKLFYPDLKQISATLKTTPRGKFIYLFFMFSIPASNYLCTF